MKKKGQESPAKGYNYGFLPFIFPKQSIYNATPPKQHVVFQVLQEDKVIDFSKRALHAGLPHNMPTKMSPSWLVQMIHSIYI